MTQVERWLNDVASMQILGPRQRQEDSALHVRLGRGRLIVVADGIDVLDIPGRHWCQDTYRGTEEDKDRARKWQDVFLHRNPQQFLAAVEDALAGGAANDNTTAIAIRTSVEQLREYEDFKDYVPVSGAPDREVLGPEPPDTQGS